MSWLRFAKGTADLDMAYDLVGERVSFDPYGYRAQLRELIQMAKDVE